MTARRRPGKAGRAPLDFAVTGALEIRATGTSSVFLLQDFGS
jgi:hypothetical protein